MPQTKEVKRMSKKRKINPFMKLLKGIHKVIDKILITPLSRIIYRINKIFKKNAGVFDGLLNKPHSLLVISLVLAVLAFLVVDSRAINIVENESEILSSQPVNVIFNEEKYVVEGIPETVDIILMGRKSDLYLAKQLGEHKVVLDLSDYKTGEYTVKMKYNHSIKSVKYELVPSTVTVKIREKVSSVRTLSYDLLNQDKLDSKLNVSEVNLKESEVYVKGSSETLARVANIKALVNVADLGLTEAGTIDVDSIPLVAYDASGKLVDNVEIVPSTASASIKVDSYYTDLPVKVVPVGDLATGYAISSAIPSIKSVRVYGDQAAINSLTSITAEIDVEGLNTNKKYNVTLTKPSGVRHMSENTTTVEVTLGNEATKEIAEIPVEFVHLNQDYVANAVFLEDTAITVILKGAENVINNINSKSVKAQLDLSGYTAGTHDVPITVIGDDLTVTYTAKVKTIQVKIMHK